MFPISGLGEPNIYQNLGDFTRMWGFYLEGVWREELSGGYLESLWLCEELSGGYLESLWLCEELSGGYSQEMMGLVLVYILLMGMR